MTTSFLSGLSDDQEIRAKSALVDRSQVLSAGAAIADSLNEAQRLAAYEQRLAAVKRKDGKLPFAVELNYLQGLRRYKDGAFRKAADGARTIVAQVEASGLNPLLSRRIQGAMVGGKFPVGAAAQEIKQAIASGTLDLSGLSTLFGLDPALVQGIPAGLTIDPNQWLPVTMAMLGISNELAWLVGMGINQPGQLLGGGAVGGGTGGVTISITKGVTLFITDLVFATEATATATLMQRLVTGVPTASVAAGPPAPLQASITVGDVAYGMAWVGTSMIGLGILLDNPAVEFAGVLLDLLAWALGQLFGAGFVDP